MKNHKKFSAAIVSLHQLKLINIQKTNISLVETVCLYIILAGDVPMEIKQWSIIS